MNNKSGFSNSIICASVLAVLYVLIMIFMNHVVGIVFPQRVITIEDIAKTQWGIRDYEILDDGTLESSSFDSWIYLEYEPL